MAKALLDRETLDREDVQMLVRGDDLPPKITVEPAPPPVRPSPERAAPAPERGPVLGTPPPEPAGA